MTFTYKYARPALTVDCIVFGVDLSKEDLNVLVIKRKNDPYKGFWALPGGFVNVGESTEDAAMRELEEETSAKVSYLEQLHTFSRPTRDPREHVVSVAYFALVLQYDVKGADDALEAKWVSIKDLQAQTMAFDHNEILNVAINRLAAKVRYSPLGFNLLPEKFTLLQLQNLYEIILARKVHKSNFRNKFLSMGILKEVGTQTDVDHRPAKIYSFDKEKYDLAIKNGFNFQI